MRILGCLLLSLFSATAGFSLTGRTFVSAASGSDSNACSRTFPCRSFTTALTATLAGGEIIVLDSGGYGPVAINQSISIISPQGVYAGISASVPATPAIAVNTGAFDRVIFDGLTLNGTGSHDGIDITTSAGVVVLKNLVVNGFPDEGLFVGTSANVIISDSTFRSNGDGIDAKTASGGVSLSIEHSRFEMNDLTGILIDDNIHAAIRNSVIHGTLNGTGLKVSPTTAAVFSEADVESCMFTGNFSGIRSGGDAGTADVRVSNSTITMNNFGLITNAGSTLRSRSNNTVESNGTDGAFTDTFAAK